MRAMGKGGIRMILVSALLCGAFPGSAAALRWSRPGSVTPDGAQSVSCASRSLCVIAANSGLLVSTAPTHGAGAWQPVFNPQQTSCPPPPPGPHPGGYFCGPSSEPPIARFGPAAVSCPSASLCVAVGTDEQSRGNEAFVSNDPTGGANSWTAVKLPGKGDVQGVSCTVPSTCVAIRRNGPILTSSNPAKAGSWTSTDLYPYQPSSFSSSGVSCVPGLCVIASGGGHGTVVSSTQPTGGVGAWNGDDIADQIDLTVVACASKHLCIAADDFGIVYSSRAPWRSDATWRSARSTYPQGNPFGPGSYPPTSASCSPQGLCAVGKKGVVMTSSHPQGGRWKKTTIDNQPFAISCPSNNLCVAVDNGGRVITGT